MAKLSRVAIIGRANVGKSTLFNRFTSGAKALVSDIAGTTRDRKEGSCVWLGKEFIIIDTGGLDVKPNDHIEQKIAEQALRAAADADLVLFLIDTKAGMTPVDRDIAQLLRTSEKPIMIVANKADNQRDHASVPMLYDVGFGKPWAVSAANGNGTGDLLDEIVKRVKTRKFEEEKSIKVAIIGKPNVGKSSLINALTGDDRSIVHDTPYTTRDANEVSIVYHGTRLTLLDTAGIRRKSKIERKTIEHDSVRSSLASIKNADVAILVTESHIPLTAQDLQLAKLMDEAKASVVIVGNKWDLVEDKDPQKAAKFETYYRKELNFIAWAPIILMSALDKTKLGKLQDAIIRTHKEQFRTITDNALSKFLKAAIKRQKPVIGKGTKKPFIHRIKQAGSKPPQFEVYIDAKSSINYTYLNFLKRQLREKFGFEGVPIKIWVKKTSERIQKK